MNQHASVAATTPPLIKSSPNIPVFMIAESGDIVIRGGTVFFGRAIDDWLVVPFKGGEPGRDYVIVGHEDGSFEIVRHVLRGIPNNALGGFHFAPGGNALARAGGDAVPQPNPCSLWDRNFRPACPDPRGMTLVEKPGGRFWCDIYLTGVDHVDNGTSAHGAIIADGDDLPRHPDWGTYKRFDYASAVALMAHHGKQLLSVDEAFAAFCGVTEKSAHDGEPRRTGLDAPRTSRFGIMQATGNMWVWGHDGDPDEPRASLFGGSWLHGENAGSRFAYVAYIWPEYSGGHIGARGRSDHLQLA